MSPSEQIRAFVAANPGCTAKEITAGCGGQHEVLSRLASKMGQRGLLNFTLQACECCGTEIKRYTLGRAPLVVKAKTEEERLERKRASYRRIDAKRPTRPSGPKRMAARLAAKLADEPVKAPEPPRPVAQTVDEFLAQGGRVEVLPVRWAA